jgi:transposase-like protein
MSKAIVKEGSSVKANQWRERIAGQERSGLTVRQFCKGEGVGEHCFYWWRRRLREEGPVRFALVEREPARQDLSGVAGLELVLATGERLRIGAGVDSMTFRMVLEALRK